MISFEDIRPQLKKFVQEGCETADYIMRVSKTPKDGIYAYEELGEIVRCRDCKWCDPAGPWCYEPSKIFIDEYGIEVCATVKPDGYCSWGERKSVGHDGA